MRQFLKANGVRHLTAAPYHPATNGLAERAVQTCKAALKKMSSGTLETKIQRFLFNYRITPQGTTGLPPAQLLMGRQLRSRLDLVVPNVAKRVQHAQVTQKEHHDAHSKARQFIIGDHILARNYAGSPQWLPGCVTSVLGPVSYEITLEDGRRWRRHQDQLQLLKAIRTENSSDHDSDFDLDLPQETVDATESPSHSMDSGLPEAEPVVRRSTRVRHPPDRLTY